MTPQELRSINKEFRAKSAPDDRLWPINGRFSVADRAIRQAYLFRRDYGRMDSLEYRLLLEQLASEIVNNSANW